MMLGLEDADQQGLEEAGRWSTRRRTNKSEGGALVAVVSSPWEQINRQDGVFVAVGSSSPWEQIDPVVRSSSWTRPRRVLVVARGCRRASWEQIDRRRFW
ncbi:hypothetical protein PR202_gb25694 [Eleusine coracana subsp. coracana]|uniref:Uncharacterized protein n=1 Tax=Eleusine coracana subsp. coracana TaxID=191504 RepID=A0AAV5FPL5_ELECO|nr:hypothetical protein PR202_gb25694 [Eleusine coracana subsp. coracana]